MTASIVLGTSILMGNAESKAKSNPVLEATIPFAFHLRTRTLPAAVYKFELATGVPRASDTISVVVIRSKEAGPATGGGGS